MKKPKGTRKRQKNQIGQIEEALCNISISEPKPKKKQIRKILHPEKCNGTCAMKSTDIKQKTLDNFLKISTDICNVKETSTARVISHEEDPDTLFSDSFNFDLSRFGDEDDLDLSNIVENIVQHKPTYWTDIEIKKLVERQSTPRKISAENDRKSNSNRDVTSESVKKCLNMSNFFLDGNDVNDAFEMTFNKSSSGNESRESTADSQEYVSDVENCGLNSEKFRLDTKPDLDTSDKLRRGQSETIYAQNGDVQLDYSLSYIINRIPLSERIKCKVASAQS